MSLSFRFFGILLFLSAFLLFFIQPLVSRLILPVLGGSPSVWNTSMLFFQTLLLGGYLWAHIMIRYMPVWAPPLIQTVIAVVTAFLVNYEISLVFDPANDSAIWWQFKTLFLMIGLPYFALATNSPLYQAIYKDFNTSKSKKTPYALYSLSNVGSFIALLGYPFVVEPLLTVGTQTTLWHYGYIVLSLIIAISGILCFMLCLKGKVATKRPVTKTKSSTKVSTKVSASTIGLWCLLAFVPSSLMLSVTSYVTTDVASTPLLWIIPLAFYLASFIMAFAEPPLWLARNNMRLNIITFLFVAVILNLSVIGIHFFTWLEMTLHYVAFLFAATLCHSKLYSLKPPAEHLTLFYLILSIGGCLGGVFNVLIAPHLFVIPVEYILSIVLLVSVFARYPEPFDRKMSLSTDVPVVLFISCIYIYLNFIAESDMSIRIFSSIALILVMACYCDTKRAFLIFSALCCITYTYNKLETGGDVIHLSRNSFGSLMIKNSPEQDRRLLSHGTTIHGVQALPLSDNPAPTAYFNRQGPLGDIFSVFDKRQGTQNIAGLGLGIGTIACYKKENRTFRFFEINPTVIDIARNPDYFTYLSSCAPDAAIIIGDARLSMIEEQKIGNNYDLIVVDTFSSDSIPVHLITKEALNVYTQTLKQDGIITFHISNRYFDLKSVVAGLAKNENFFYAMKHDDKGTNDSFYLKSTYVALSKDKKVIDDLIRSNEGWEIFEDEKELPLWTDDYVNIFSSLKD